MDRSSVAHRCPASALLASRSPSGSDLTVTDLRFRLPTRSSWVAFAATHAHATPCTGELAPTNTAEELRAVPDEEQARGTGDPVGAAPFAAEEDGDDEETKAWHPLNEIEAQDDPSASTVPSTSVPPQDIHEQPTEIRADLDALPAPTVSTGFFSQQAATVSDTARRRRPARRPCWPRALAGAGGVALALASIVLVVVFVLSDGTPKTAEPPIPATDPSAARISVYTQPEGAEILLCGEPTGLVAPAQVPVRASERCSLELRLEGYDSYRLPMMPRAEQPTAIFAALRRRPARGR